MIFFTALLLSNLDYDGKRVLFVAGVDNEEDARKMAPDYNYPAWRLDDIMVDARYDEVVIQAARWLAHRRNYVLDAFVPRVDPEIIAEDIVGDIEFATGQIEGNGCTNIADLPISFYQAYFAVAA